MTQLSTAAAPARTVGASWRWAAPALILSLAVAVAAFRAPLAAAVQTWSGSATYEHGYVVVAVVLALIWAERSRLARQAPQPSVWGVALAGAAAALAAIAGAAAVQVVEQLAFVLMLHALTLAVAGPRVWRILSFPLFYLILAVPFGDALLPWLRALAAHAVVAMLEAGGVIAVLDGYVVRLPDADYLIAEACSGLRFLLVSLAAALLAAHLLLRSWRRRLLLLATAVLLPLVANALRSALLIWLAARGVLEVKSAAMHLTYGLGLTGILLAALMLLAWLLRESRRPMKLAPVGFAKPGSPVVILASAATVALLALIPATLRGHEPIAHPVELALPQVGGEWRADEPGADLLDRAALGGADGRLAGAWRSQSARIELLLHYYARERQGSEAVGQDPVSPGWVDVGGLPVRLTLDGQTIEAEARRRVAEPGSGA